MPTDPSGLLRAAAAAYVSLALLGAAAPPSAPPPMHRSAPLTLLSRQFGLGDPTPVTASAAPLVEAPFVALPPASPQQGGFTRPFGDTGATSRCPQTLPAGMWTEAWSAALDGDFPPAFVAAATDRILVQGGGGWLLFDEAGHRVAAGRSGPGPVFLDAAHDRLVLVDRDEQLTALRLRDGGFDFRVPLPFGDLFAKPLLAWQGDALLVIAVEQPGMPHRPAPPDQSAIQVIGTGAPLTRFDDGMLSSLTRDEKLLIGSADLVATLQDGRVIAAWPDHLLRVGLDLAAPSIHEARFAPGPMAQDEAGRAYLLVQDGEGGRALWVISATGQRIVTVPLPLAFGTLFMPPMVGFDHHVFIVTRSRLIALAPSGQTLWEQAAQSRFSGASVTADGHVMAADGRAVVSFRADGTRTVLAELTGPVLAAPILSGQTLLAAEAGRLHAFGRR